MKKGVTKMSNRISAWLLTLVMIVGLVAVPAGEVKAAEPPTWDLTVKSGYSSTSVTIAKDEWGDDYIGDVLFDVPNVAESKSAISSNGITSMEVELTVNSFTAGVKTPSVMLYVQPGEDGKWEWNATDGVNLVKDQKITLTYEFSSMNWNGGSTMGKLGLRFANCADGSMVSFTINSAKLIGGGSTSGSGSESSGGATSDEVTAEVKKKSGGTDWAEYNYSVTNGTDSAISGIRIKAPASGSVNDLKSWGCSVSYSGGYIIISHSAVLQAGETYSCIGSEDIKFGFGGGASLGTPTVEFVYGEDGGGTSSSALNYELTGTTKNNVAPEDTPVGKHGKLSLKKVDGYSAPIIVDKNGKPFQLRGASTHGMQWDAGGPFVNKASFQSLRDEWGVNMVRLASYVTQYNGYTKGGQQDLDGKIQTGVKAATELGMYVIVDWHIHEEDPHATISWAREFFKKYATMYKDYDNVIFEICNEPTGVDWYKNGSGGDLYTYCKEIAGIIRDCGSNALIVCGTNTWSQDVDDVAQKPLKDDGFENILYTFHFYSGSHYVDKMNKVKTALAAGTPIFVTEFGICDASGNGGYDTANADKWIEFCDANNISYACWSLSNKDESASYFKSSCNKTTGGWVESDLSTTGIWLVNTYRAHQDKEEGTNTSKGELKISIDPASGQLDDVEEGYSNPGKFTITVSNAGDKALEELSVKLGRTDTAFEIIKDFESTTLGKDQETTLEISLKPNQPMGIYDDSVIVKSGSLTKTVNVKQKVVEAEVPAVPVTSLTVAPTGLNLVMGDEKTETGTLTATVLPENATNRNVIWSSANEKVATVSQEGVVTAVGSGGTVITVTTKSKSDKGEPLTATCNVTVTNPLRDFELQKELALVVGDKEQLSITPIPLGADPTYTVDWSSDNNTVVKVDSDGMLTAVGEGTANITAKVAVKDRNIEKKCTVTVTPKLERIHFGLENNNSKLGSIDLKKTETVTLKVVPEPAGALLGDITFASSNEESVTVSGDGDTCIVKAVAKGNARITATTLGQTAECTVNVIVPVERIEIWKNLELQKGKSVELSNYITIYPEDANNKTVSWKSSNDQVVTVDENGRATASETADAKATADITVTTADGNKTATCTIKVVNTPVEKIEIKSDDNVNSIMVGDTIDLIAEVTPSTADSAEDIEWGWEFSSEGIANVSPDTEHKNKVTIEAVKGGEVTVTARVGNFEDTFKLTITKKTQKPPMVIAYKVFRRGQSITVSDVSIGNLAESAGVVQLRLSNAGGDTEWIPAGNGEYQFDNLPSFTPYMLQARFVGNDIYNDSAETDIVKIYTLVDNPYNINVKNFKDSELAEAYEDALRKSDEDDPTVSYEDGKLTLSNNAEVEEGGYTITGENEDITIVTKDGDYDITLDNTTIKQVDVSESDNVDIHIKGKVTVKDGIVSHKDKKDKDTNIDITGEGKDKSILDTPSVRTEGSLTIEDVTVNADVSKSESGSEGPALSGKDVTIKDSKVDATGGDGSPAIEADDQVTIKDSEVKAKGGSNAPAVEGDKVVMDDSKVDLEADSGQKGVQAKDIEVNNTDVSFNGSKDASLDDIYSVTPKDKSGKPLTDKKDQDKDKDTKDPNTKVVATSLTLTGTVKNAKNIPVGSTIKLAPKKSITLKVAAFLPGGAEKESVIFTSSKPSVAKVSSSGKITAGKNAGTAKITVKTASGKATKTITVKVMKKAVSKVTIKASKTTVKVKKTIKLKATLTPNKKQASDNVFWKSSKPKVATVSSKGVVKGVKKGKAKITATATDGSGKKATVTITVTK